MKIITPIILLLAVLTSNSSFATQTLKSHRAIYDLSLTRADSGSGVESLTGRIVHEWSRQCDGNVLNQATLMVLRNSQGTAVTTQDETSLWESNDGKHFRFFNQHKINGKLENRNSGDAKIKPDGSGTVTFSQPRKRKLSLPNGVLFPTALTIEAIQRGLAGETFFNRPVFDGTDKAGAYRTTIFFGKAFKTPPDYVKSRALLKGVTGWPVRVAYFKYANPEAIPEVEIKLDLFRNGIAGNMEFDYGSFAVRARLKLLESLDEPKC